ncbi:MAG: flagellar hook-basal body complex protein, partial [Pararhodobacter sp.]
MDNATYASLTRQSGLMREMRVVAHNIANANTPSFRREGVSFAEHLAALDRHGDTLSMAHARGRLLDLRQGALTQTNNRFDLAIEGEGFFLVETPDGQRLTRAGAFTPSAEGELMNSDGHRLLDEGGGP